MSRVVSRVATKKRGAHQAPPRPAQHRPAGQTEHEGGEHERHEVAGRGSREDLQAGLAAAEDRQADEADEQVEQHGRRGAARPEHEAGEHDGKGLQRDGHADRTDGDARDHGSRHEQRREDGDEAHRLRVETPRSTARRRGR